MSRTGGPEAYPRHVVTARGSRSRSRIRRDRRGRGLRGPLYPSSVPVSRSRAQRFDALVLQALEPIEQRWHAELTQLDVAVDEVPEVGTTRPDKVVWDDDVVVDANVPLARLVPAGVDRRGLPTQARIVLYRRPLEARARDGTDMADLLHDVLVEQVATYLGLDPDVIEGQ
ncbi:metallopeptidase family protein [Saccharopolyspora halophila]|uniref:Metallopeptidase family protein n=1 Tax=Saccharopolyspora halophila TaxID=405551 RepID=A0ABN3FWN6_9PSEU